MRQPGFEPGSRAFPETSILKKFLGKLESYQARLLPQLKAFSHCFANFPIFEYGLAGFESVLSKII